MTHVWNSSNLRRKDEQREHYEHKECQYKGSIADDDKSIVAVSLCDGMVSLFSQQTLHACRWTRGENDLDTKYIRNNSYLIKYKKTSFSIFLNSIRFASSFLKINSLAFYYADQIAWIWTDQSEKVH